MKPIQKVTVSLDFGDKELQVGELIKEGRGIYFKYYTEFIKTGLELSPFYLPLNDSIYTAPVQPFEGLFGVFSDSLPDGWGRLLLDRTLTAKGILVQDITPLQRLSYVGLKGMGALLYRPQIETAAQETLLVDLEAIAKEMTVVLQGASSLAIDELYEMGGSSGGARPKILVGYHPKTEHLIHGIEPLPKGYEHWLIKFPSSNDRTDIASIEYAYHKMALTAGINMNPCKLFETESGKVFFGTKRFDRSENGRLHLHSAAGMLNDNFRYSTMDYGNLMDATFRLEQDVAGQEKILRIAAFNVFAHNRDDHSKNISYLMDAAGKWQLAPAYDLTYSNSLHGMHSTTIAREGTNPGKSHLLELANEFRLKNGAVIIEQVKHAISQWKRYAKEAGVTKESMDLIEKKMQSTLKL
ncbi:type II toxin-antitoxin system HipA family toxin [Flavobacterium sp. 102]|uniref:type II toxin-antitoxin system HipA family toxin n=1 Tax=Flavobacterium sp. 102 TaxID=2135623 RepID=UPI000EB0F596|nr:type II toxin-antitoxin system HipA family toxin [Flavobacterium sp. 102]RKS03109.1 serine/threonine-protein kinase HipA [Flavobacterium sp. 102]